MSFSVTVHSPNYEVKPYPENKVEQEAWNQYYLQNLIYDEPLGTDRMIHDYWHYPAHKIGLDLISQIYNIGLNIKVIDEYMQLRSELQMLINYWQNNLFDKLKTEIKDDLLQRAEYLERAIEIGLKIKGTLNIS